MPEHMRPHRTQPGRLGALADAAVERAAAEGAALTQPERRERGVRMALAGAAIAVERQARLMPEVDQPRPRSPPAPLAAHGNGVLDPVHVGEQDARDLRAT